MKTCKLFLLAILILSVSAFAKAQTGSFYFAVDAEPFNHSNGSSDHADYGDIRLPYAGGSTKNYIMTGYSGFKFYIEIAQAGNYKLSLWGCSGNKTRTNTGALCIDQPHTDVPGVDPGNNRYTVMFDWPYSYDEGALERKFIKMTFAESYYFTAGEHYIVYDSWDPGTYSHQRIAAIEVERIISSVNEITAPESAVLVVDGLVKVTPVAADNYSLNVFSVSGSKVWSRESLSNMAEISGLQKGVYLLQINTKLGRDVQKVVVK
jgi:hypothetical protein